MIERLRSAIATGVKEWGDHPERKRRTAEFVKFHDTERVLRQLDRSSPAALTILAFLGGPKQETVGLFIAAIDTLEFEDQ